jgi:hypothetical protein
MMVPLPDIWFPDWLNVPVSVPHAGQLMVYVEFPKVNVPGFKQLLDCATPVVRFRLILWFRSDATSTTRTVPAQTSAVCEMGAGGGAVGAGASTVQPTATTLRVENSKPSFRRNPVFVFII